MFLTLAAILLAVFVANIALGAGQNAPFLSDVTEMIVLFAASVSFTAAILNREARAATNKIHEPKGGTDGS